MSDFIVVALACTLGLALVWTVIVLLKARNPKQAAPTPAKRVDPMRFQAPEQSSDPRNIKVGYMIEIFDITYYVREILYFTQGSWKWMEAYLDNGAGATGWLSIEADPDLELVFWTDIDPEDNSPGDKTITIGGVVYKLSEHDSANYTASVGEWLGKSGTIDYYDYNGTGDRDTTHISFEKYGDALVWELSSGIDIPVSALMILPSVAPSGGVEM